jgi:hypothetical protein
MKEFWNCSEEIVRKIFDNKKKIVHYGICIFEKKKNLTSKNFENQKFIFRNVKFLISKLIKCSTSIVFFFFREESFLSPSIALYLFLVSPFFFFFFLSLSLYFFKSLNFIFSFLSINFLFFLSLKNKKISKKNKKKKIFLSLLTPFSSSVLFFFIFLLFQCCRFSSNSNCLWIALRSSGSLPQ